MLPIKAAILGKSLDLNYLNDLVGLDCRFRPPTKTCKRMGVAACILKHSAIRFVAQRRSLGVRCDDASARILIRISVTGLPDTLLSFPSESANSRLTLWVISPVVKCYISDYFVSVVDYPIHCISEQ